MYPGPQSKNLRLKTFDYNQAGYYFVTMCCKNREHFFGEIREGNMQYSQMGEIARQKIESNIRENMVIDAFIIMPNHIHTIIIIRENASFVGNADLRSLRGETMFQDRTKMQLSKIIHGLKSSFTREIRKNYGDDEFAWQKSFYDVIIRNEEQLQKTRSDVNYV